MTNKENNLETVFIKDRIAKCEDLDELKAEIFPMIKSQQEEWAGKICEIIEENSYSKTVFSEICGVSRMTVNKWCKGAIPKNRETFLRIGMAADYNIEQMNKFLQRYGRYPALYSKSMEDCIYMYVIKNYDCNDRIEKYQYIINRIKEQIIRDDTAVAEDVSTQKFDDKLSKVQNEEELEQFITENIAIFANAYHKFYAYVKMNIAANYMEHEYAENVFEMAEIQGWSSSLRQSVSAIRQSKWYPTRNKIISLGLHLSMDHEQINQMLELAHMEPLCAKNIFESVIMFILDDASLNNMLDIDSESFDPDELCSYARDILKQLDLPEIEDFISELPEVEDAW